MNIGQRRSRRCFRFENWQFNTLQSLLNPFADFLYSPGEVTTYPLHHVGKSDWWDASKATDGFSVLDFVFHQAPAEVFTPRPYGLLRRSDSAEAILVTFPERKRLLCSSSYLCEAMNRLSASLGIRFHCGVRHKAEMPAKAPCGGFQLQLWNGMRPL
jgi:hypothetical protein